MAGLIAPLIGSDMAVREANPQKTNLNSILPELERAVIAKAVEKRQREFITGRLLAREAMLDLGLSPEPIPASKDCSPVWPEGVVGSLSHTDQWCVAVVARFDRVRAIGVDVETAKPLEHHLLKIICSENERARLASKPIAIALTEAKRIFSAKEAVFKALSPMLHMRFISFEAFTITFDDSKWTAIIEDPELEKQLDGQLLCGHWTEIEGLIGTLMVIR